MISPKRKLNSAAARGEGRALARGLGDRRIHAAQQRGPGDAHTLQGLIDAADRALYASKTDGRNLVSFADVAAA